MSWRTSAWLGAVMFSASCVSATLIDPPAPTACDHEALKAGFVILAGTSTRAMLSFEATYNSEVDAFDVEVLCGADRETSLGFVGRLHFEATDGGGYTLTSDSAWTIPTRGAWSASPTYGETMQVTFEVTSEGCARPPECVSSRVRILAPATTLGEITPPAALFVRPVATSELRMADGDLDAGTCGLIPLDTPSMPCPPCGYFDCLSFDATDPDCRQCLDMVCGGHAQCCAAGTYDACEFEFISHCGCWQADI